MAHKIALEVEKQLEIQSARERLEQRVQGSLRAYLFTLEKPEDDPEVLQDSLQELGALVRTLGDECVGVAVQKKAKPLPGTYLGVGKVEELGKVVEPLQVDYFLCNAELSPSQVRNLEHTLHRPVIDRTGVILQIFRKNAHTKEAKTQVEIAQLEYLSPRLSNAWITWERQRGGGGVGGALRGAGETQLELDRRRIRDRIAHLKKDLERIEKERETQSKNRSEEWNVVMVGYTNAGKTTLMNALTDSQLSAKDSLFETLDSSVRRLPGEHHPAILMTDTVGFIRDLPHSLVASFRATLEASLKADLILHVVDVSHSSYRDHMAVTESVLTELGAAQVPRMLVFNKLDAVPGETKLGKILAKAYPGSLCISGHNPVDIKELKQRIVQFLSQDMIEHTFHVPLADNKTISFLYTHTRILRTEWTPEEGIFQVRMFRGMYNRLMGNPQDEE